MRLSDFLNNYIQNKAFFVVHMLIWAIALVLWVRLLSRRGALVQKLAELREISESQYRSMAASIDEPHGAFDICSSAFILVGLIGTIYGFATGIPKLNDPKYEFKDLAKALSTSAFGIIWSLLLNTCLSLYYGLRVAPLLSRLRAETTEDLAQVLARELRRIGSDLAPIVNNSLTQFATASRELSAATQELVQASRFSAQAFREATEESADTAKKVSNLLKRTAALPEEISTRLRAVFDSTAKSLLDAAGAVTNALDPLNSLPGELRKGIGETLDAQLTLINKAVAEFGNASQRVQADWSSLAERIAATLTDGVQEIVGLPERVGEQTKALADSYRKLLEDEHKKMTEQLRQCGAQLVVEQVGTLKQATADLAATANRVETDYQKIFEDERKAVQEAIAQCFTDVRTFVESYRKQLAGVEKELPAELRTVHTDLIDQAAKTERALLDCANTLREEADNTHKVLSGVNTSMTDFKATVGDLSRIVTQVGSLGKPPEPVLPRPELDHIASIVSMVDSLKVTVERIHDNQTRGLIRRLFR